MKEKKTSYYEQIRTGFKKSGAWLESVACVIAVSQTEIVIGMLSPKADFNCCLFISAATNRPEAQLQLSLISTVTSDLEALARKGAEGFVLFHR